MARTYSNIVTGISQAVLAKVGTAIDLGFLDEGAAKFSAAKIDRREGGGGILQLGYDFKVNVGTLEVTSAQLAALEAVEDDIMTLYLIGAKHQYSIPDISITLDLSGDVSPKGKTLLAINAEKLLSTLADGYGITLPADALIVQTAYNTTAYLGSPSADQNQILGQGFQLSSAALVTGVEIREGTPRSGIPTGNWTLRIETDAAGSPSGTLADANASVVVTPPGVSTIVKGSFASPFQLAASTPYWIVIRDDTQSEDRHWNLSVSNANPYANGACKYKPDGGSWTAIATTDLYFKLYAIV